MTDTKSIGVKEMKISKKRTVTYDKISAITCFGRTAIEGSIATIKHKKKDDTINTLTVVGRITQIEDGFILVDCSSEYHSCLTRFDFEDILDVIPMRV